MDQYGVFVENPPGFFLDSLEGIMMLFCFSVCSFLCDPGLLRLW